MERKSWLRAVVLGVIAVAVLLSGGIFYLYKVERALWDQAVANVLEVTVQGGHAFEVFVDQGFTMMDSRANTFAQYPSSDAKTIGEKADLFDGGDTAFAVIDLTHGVIYFSSQAKAELSAQRVEEYLALDRFGFLEPYLDEYTGLRVVGYYERFTFADGAQGIVRKSLRVSDMAAQFSLSFYDGAGYSYVVNGNGDIILRSAGSGNRTFANLYDMVALDDNTPEDVATLWGAMSSGKRGVIRLNSGGEKHVLAFVPLNCSDGWYLVSVIPNSVIAEHTAKLSMSTQLFVIVMGAGVVIFLVFLLVVAQYRRRIRSREMEVLYREQLFSILASNTGDIYLLVSADRSEVKYVSPNVERVMGISEAEVVQNPRTLRHLIHSVNDEFNFREADIPLGESLSIEGSYTHPATGEERWFVESIYHDVIHQVERYIIVLDDRTEDKKKEAALSEALEIAEVANRSKSTFLSNMSHDIRTPMNAIVGLSTLLQRDAEDAEKVREHTRKITASSQHLLGLINDVLDMSKIESGKTTLNIGDFNLAELVDELGVIMRPQAKAKKQEFNVHVQDIHNEDLVGDKLRINQVLINILSNAVKYTPDGGTIDLSVQQLGQATQDISRIRFTIADNGIGMTEEYQKEIFQPFTRETRTVVNQIQGTGLGMAITKSLVDLMGGVISVTSKVGEGSTFVLELDLRVQNHEDDLTFWKDHHISNTLVVDDEADICTGILSAMAGTGVSMQFALDGATAVRMTQSANKEGRNFDLILLDWKMPGMDGLETARQIRATVPAHIPIMILTAYDYEEIRDEGLSVGIDGFLSKPFFLSNFKEVVRTLDKSRVTETVDVGASLKGRHFLCAEDNELNAEILAELLDIEGATCDRACDGKEAVEMFSAAPAGTYDAILMDVQMPVLDGYGATRAIRALDLPQAASIPIVAMTANAFADDIRDALNAGMNAHVAKPVDMANLIQVLARLWAERQ